MANNNFDNYPILVTGLGKNKFAQDFVLDTMPIDQLAADRMCAAIQAAIGGKLEVREWTGVSKTGKNLPGYKLQAVTAQQLADRKAFGAQRKAEGTVHTAGDQSL